MKFITIRSTYHIHIRANEPVWWKNVNISQSERLIKFHTTLALCKGPIRKKLSSLLPLTEHILLTFIVKKTIVHLLACLSRWVIIPTRPVLRPPITITVFPVSNLIKSLILPVLISMTTVSLTFMVGSGYLMVLASCVTRYGTEFLPYATRFTFPNLY